MSLNSYTCPYGTTSLEVALREKILYYLTACMEKNAIFLAERLLIEDPKEENILLLAKCFYQSGQYNHCVSILQDSKLEECRFLQAKCYYELNKLEEAENSLLQGNELQDKGPLLCKDQLISGLLNVPGGAVGIYLLGCICKRSNRRKYATAYFSISLQKDQFLWCSYEALCEMGEDIQCYSHFGNDTCYTKRINSVSKSLNISSDAYFEANEEIAATPLKKTNLFGVFESTPENHTPTGRLFGTPQDNSDKDTLRPGKLRKHSATEDVIKPLPRRSARLSVISSDIEENEQCNTKQLSTPTTNKSNEEDNIVRKGNQAILVILCSFGDIYLKVCKYMCRDAIDAIYTLPEKHLLSGWAQHQLGRCYFETSDYKKACEAFDLMHRKEPYRTAGLDIYSTALWHLQKEVDMCYLAQEVTTFDKLAPEAWCIVGNCFGLQKEPELALKFFQRALQIDPHFTYAYTLCGHEYVANEDFDKAISSYRHAIQSDPRHYNAWYGLGTIYYRQEKFELAEYHFRRAIQINPRSSLLYCYLGMVLHSSKKCTEALQMLAKASVLHPTNPQARFQRANVLISLEHYDEALKELEEVQNCAPKESSVHFLMGKVCKKLGRINEALDHFSNALFFHPKDNNLIKAAIDRLNESDNEEDDRI